MRWHPIFALVWCCVLSIAKDSCDCRHDYRRWGQSNGIALWHVVWTEEAESLGLCDLHHWSFGVHMVRTLLVNRQIAAFWVWSVCWLLYCYPFRSISKLYEDPNWSQTDLSAAIQDACRNLTKSKSSAYSFDRIAFYRDELTKRASMGYKTSFSDLWGLVLEALFCDGVSLLYTVAYMLQIYWLGFSQEFIHLLLGFMT